MITSKFVVFGTAWRTDVTLSQNLRNMANLTETLTSNGVQYQAVLGRYATSEEQSLAMAVYSLDVAKQYARHVGAVYQQECVGVLDVQQMDFALVYPDGRVEPLGKFRPVTEAEAFRADASTYWQGQYWIAG